MKFSVGYQLFKDDSFIDEIIKYKDNISEVYLQSGAKIKKLDKVLKQKHVDRVRKM